MCPNGFGHIKRCVAVAEELISETVNIMIEWFLSTDSNRLFSKVASKNLKSHSKLNFFNNLESISLRNVYKNNFELKYNIWSEKLKTLIDDNDFDLVISDNICKPLSYHNNCVILGSFLWHDIAKKTFSNTAVIASEKKIFREFRPTVFAMENFVMPEIYNYGNVVEFPSLIKTQEALVKDLSLPYKIFFTFGSSRDLNGKYKMIKETLDNMENTFILYDSSYYDNTDNDYHTFFDFSNKSFSQLSLIVTRPGIGIISDSIKFQIPLVVDSFYLNKEIEFNAQKIEELGIGIRLNFSDLKNLNSNILNIIKNKKNSKMFFQNFNKINTGGAKVVSKHILSFL